MCVGYIPGIIRLRRADAELICLDRIFIGRSEMSMKNIVVHEEAKNLIFNGETVPMDET
jgi:hypothetical protein